MSNFLLILSCLGLGAVLRARALFPREAHLSLNAFIIYISLPALTLRVVPALTIHPAMLLPFTAGVLIFGLAGLFFKLMARYFSLDRATEGCLVLVCGLGNTSFVGFPVIEALYGAEGLQVAILVDQGTFLTLAVGGVLVALRYSGEEVKVGLMLRKVLYFPPFLAFGLALLWMPWGVPDILKPVLDKLAATLTPLALVSVGLQLRFDLSAFRGRDFGLGLGYKLFMAPAFIGALAWLWLDTQSLLFRVTVLEAAMAPMVTASILASQSRLNPPLANLLVGLGIPLSGLSLAGWVWWLG